MLWFVGALTLVAAEQFSDIRAKAAALLHQGKVAEAIPLLEHAQRLNPRDYPNSYDLTLAYLDTGRVDDARRQAKLLGDKAEVDSLLGDIEAAAGHPEEALRYLRRSAEREPTAPHLLTLGNFLVARGASVDAVKVYRWAIERYPASSPLHVGLGVALYANSNYDEAVQALCQAVDLDPKDPRPLEFLGKMHDVSPQLAREVSSRLKGFVNRYPQNAQAHLYYGLSVWKLEPENSLDLAEKHLVTAARLDPTSPEIQLQLGSLYEKRQKDALAAKSLEAAVRLDPKSEKALYRLGQVYQRLGRRDDAQRVMAEVRRLKESANGK